MTHFIYLYALVCFSAFIYVAFCLRQMNPRRAKLPMILVLIGLAWAGANAVLSWADLQNFLPKQIYEASWLGAAIYAKLALCALVKKYGEDVR